MSTPPDRRRGRLRVYVGAAPGVGKTYKMLEEAHRRRARGTDVVVGVVETHDRAATASLLAGLEVLPRRRQLYRGATLDELDVDALIARRPDVALIDEMAHSNAPGSANEKRWQDIDQLLEAGIDVLTTVNIQHLESLNDSLLDITGVAQRETVPDEVVRRADQVELVDMAPQALRRRISHGNVYPADRIDASLDNYFREGNLSALRELALRWVADRVDDELLEYRDRHGIERPWETRERIVVAITGSPSGAELIRRAARMAERSRAELLGVHVRRGDGLEPAGGEAILAEHRRLVSDVGGRYHEIVGDDPAAQLVAFARSENATQMVIGATRRSRLDELLHGSIVRSAIRASRDIDVHVIAVEDAALLAPAPRLPVDRRWASPRRRATAWAVGLLGPAALTAMFVPVRGDEGLPGVLPAYLLLVVATALIGGTGPALAASVAGFVLGNIMLTQPYGTLRITAVANIVALVSFLAIAVVVALLVGRLAVRTAEANRARAHARALASSAASLAADEDAVSLLLDRLRSSIGLSSVAIVDERGNVIAGGATEGVDGSATGAATSERYDLPEGRALVIAPAVSSADDRPIVRAFADQLGTAIRRNELAADEARARTLVEIDRFRTALLRSVSHDLRTPLASIKAAASSLQQDDVDWPVDARREFVATIVEEGDRLDRIVANLLDASRLEAGVLAVEVAPVDVADLLERVVALAPTELALEVEVPDGLTVMADRTLLERVIENLLANAARYAPGEVTLRASAGHGDGDGVELAVVDHGPGVDEATRATMFSEFQRFTDSGAGVGLGLAVARGFVEAMGGVLTPSDTLGGGLTMTIVLPDRQHHA
jgi:two-component system sensor histidine kinase KdpD